MIDVKGLPQVSLPDIGESTFDFMNAIYAIMEPHLQGYNLWQVSFQDMYYTVATFKYDCSSDLASALSYAYFLICF